MFEVRILQPEDAPEILKFEKARQSTNGLSPEDNELASWHASWRQESLDFYLPLGWSFGIWSKERNEFLGYFLAQPILFQMGLTQALWVERLNTSDANTFNELLTVSTTLSREKHFQKVYFNKQDDIEFGGLIAQLKTGHSHIYEMKTAKF